MNNFRIIVGSYEHNLLCLAVDLSLKEPLFTPIFHFQAHALSVRSLDTLRRYLVSGSNDEHVKIYDLQNRKELGDLLAHQGSVNLLRFTSNGKWLLSAGEDGLIICWRVKDWEIFSRLKGHRGIIAGLSIHPSGKIAISCGEKDGLIILWNLMTGKRLSIMKLKGKDSLGQRCLDIKWSLKGDHVIVLLERKLIIYDASNFKILINVSSKSTLMTLDQIVLDNKELLLIGMGNGSLVLYELTTLLKETLLIENVEPVFKLQGHTNRIKNFKIYQDRYLVSISSDGKIVIWDLTTKDQIAVYDSGERLTSLTLCDELVEKYVPKKEYEDYSEYETDDELDILLMKSSEKKKNKKKKTKISVELE